MPTYSIFAQYSDIKFFNIFKQNVRLGLKFKPIGENGYTTFNFELDTKDRNKDNTFKSKPITFSNIIDLEIGSITVDNANLEQDIEEINIDSRIINNTNKKNSQYYIFFILKCLKQQYEESIDLTSEFKLYTHRYFKDAYIVFKSFYSCEDEPIIFNDKPPTKIDNVVLRYIDKKLNEKFKEIENLIKPDPNNPNNPLQNNQDRNPLQNNQDRNNLVQNDLVQNNML